MDRAGLKWPPIQRVYEQLSKNEVKEIKNLQATSLYNSNAISTPNVPLTFNKSEKTKHENFNFVHLLSSSTGIAQKVYGLYEF